MNSSLQYRRALLVGSTDAEMAETFRLFQAHGELAGFTVTTIGEANAVQHLQKIVAMDEMPAVVLIGADVANVAVLTRALQRLAVNSYLIFVETRGGVSRIEKKLALLPMAGLHWSVADIADPTFAQTVIEAAQAAHRRRQLRTTINRANEQISAYHAADNLLQLRSAISDHYLANFLAHAQDAIVALDTEFRVLYWSVGAERLFGRSDKDTIGVAASSLPFWSPKLQDHLSELRSETGTLTIESVYTATSGEVALESVCSAVRDETGKFIGTSLIIRDVSVRHKRLATERAERTKATRVIDRERRHLRSLFQQAPGFIAVTTGPDHIFEVVNDAYLQIIGHRPILGKTANEALPEMQGQEFLTLLDRVYSSGTPYVGRDIAVSVQRKADAALETLFVDFVFQPIMEEDGVVTGIFCQGSDITLHKQTQEKLALHQRQLEELVRERTKELELSQQALHRSQKLEAIGQLTGGVAHDFNNVLQIIAGNLQLLQLDAGDPTQKQGFLNAAVDAVDRGTKLSSQLLAFARRQPLQPVSINLSRVLRAMDDLLRRALGETIEIEAIVAGGLWSTMVDPNQLENVILNLAINARDAMPDGGKLTMELGNAMLDDQYVLTQPDVPAGQYVMLAISDTGKGMSAEVMERAFDPFFTTKREGEGTGLGLSMAYGFIKQSGGHIRIYSELGSGTTFKIYLPRSYELEVEPPKLRKGPVVGGSETILVVEDDPAVQETAVLMLKDLGYKVLKAADGQSALNVLQSGVAVDMLFTDVVMPGPVRSPDLAKQAQQILPDIAVLFTSGYTQNAIVHGGRLDPGVELLSKPYRREDLARKIRHIFANSRQSRGNTALKLPRLEAIVPAVDSLRILVVEDDFDSQEAVCHLMDILGHKTKGVASAEAALEALASAEFDLLFTDVNLPGLSGIELAKQASEVQPEMNVIIASGYGAAIEEDLRSPPVILPKPFDLAALRKALATACGGDRAGR